MSDQSGVLDTFNSEPTESTTQVIKAGESPDFDSLGEMETVNDDPQIAAAKEAAEHIEKTSKKESKEKAGDKSGETDKETKKEEFDSERGTKDDKEEDDGKSKKEDKKDEPEAKSEKDTGNKGRPKEIKGKVGEDEVKIRADTVIPVKIDGKVLDVPISELRDSFSGLKHNANEALRVKTEKQELIETQETFKGEQQKLVGFLGEIMESVKGDKPFDALKKIVDLSGENMYSIENKLIKHFTPIIEELQEMDDAEVEAFFLKRENDNLRQYNESVKGRQAEEQKLAVSQTQLLELREAHGVSEQDYRLAEKDLREIGVKDVGPEKVIMQHLNYVAVEKADGLLQEIDPKFAEDDELVKNLAEFLIEEADGLTRDEIIFELKKELLDGSESKNEIDELADKVNSKIVEKNPPQQPSKEYQAGAIESFDDYETELYGF